MPNSIITAEFSGLDAFVTEEDLELISKDLEISIDILKSKYIKELRSRCCRCNRLIKIKYLMKMPGKKYLCKNIQRCLQATKCQTIL